MRFQELLEKHPEILGTREYATVPLPGSEDGAELAVRCLSEAELDGCRIQAQMSFRALAAKRGWDVTEALAMDPDLFQRLVERSIVARAFFDAATIETEDPAPYFAGEEDINLVSSSLHQSLFNIYLEHQESLWPRLDLTPAEITAMADGTDLGNRRADNALSALGKSSLVRLCGALLRAHKAKSQAAS